MKNVVVVESPAKAKTINKYLGAGYNVLASFGHVRDLPAKDGSVRPDADFEMDWEVDGKSAKRLSDIAAAVKSADGLILATDPDREGEAISWHVLEVLRKKKAIGQKPVSRVVFNEITKRAVTEAMQHPREIDADLVDAYLARRALDYLVGFTLSPVLWRKLPGARSAGRVQSVALRLVCDREEEIERFVAREYWSIVAHLLTPRSDAFAARLTAFDGKKIGRLDIGDGARAATIRAMLERATFKALSVEAKPTKRNPGPPFTTSTLQQAASAKLGFSAQRTMQIAQKLYEGVDIGGETVGLITYMRTDGVQMAQEAIEGARAQIVRDFSERHLPEKPRYYSAKAKNAQEAHEAIRPTSFARHPREMAKHLDSDGARLYELIWKRGIASQMASAEIERTTVEIEAKDGAATAMLRATGQVITFEGFIGAYMDHRDDQKRPEDDEDEDGRLPAIKAGEALSRDRIEASQHFTEPPPRYSEASLIKRMEELGIGRPSTYTATLATLRDREYVRVENRKLVPEAKGRLVTAFLESFFERYVEYDFTAALEERLDLISDGKLAWRDVLADFWREFSAHVDQTKELRITDVLDALNEHLEPLVFPRRADGSDPRGCPKCGTGRLSLKLGNRSGAFIGCSNYPECSYTRNFGAAETADGELADGPKALGKDPYTQEEITLRSGRFGPYIQRGDGKEAKRSSLPKNWKPADIDHEKALALLSLPRVVGQHPETGKPISAGLGRYGPFLLHDGKYANLESIEDVFSVGLNRAVSIIAEKALRGNGRAGGQSVAAPMQTLGDHPDGGAVTLHAGRYGPYVKWGKVNATIPKGKDPAALTLADAIALISARAANSGGKPPRGAARKGSSKNAEDAATPTKRKPAAKPKAKASRAGTAANAAGKAGTAKKSASKPAGKAG